MPTLMEKFLAQDEGLPEVAPQQAATPPEPSLLQRIGHVFSFTPTGEAARPEIPPTSERWRTLMEWHMKMGRSAKEAIGIANRAEEPPEAPAFPSTFQAIEHGAARSMDPLMRGLADIAGMKPPPLSEYYKARGIMQNVGEVGASIVTDIAKYMAVTMAGGVVAGGAAKALGAPVVAGQLVGGAKTAVGIAGSALGFGALGAVQAEGGIGKRAVGAAKEAVTGAAFGAIGALPGEAAKTLGLPAYEMTRMAVLRAAYPDMSDTELVKQAAQNSAVLLGMHLAHNLGNITNYLANLTPERRLKLAMEPISAETMKRAEAQGLTRADAEAVRVVAQEMVAAERTSEAKGKATPEVKSPAPVAKPTANVAQTPPKTPTPKTVKAAPAPESEFRTSIKNAVVDSELAAIGLPPSRHGERLIRDNLLSKADATVKADPFAGQRLTQQLAANPRPPTPLEETLLMYERVRLTKERMAAEDGVIEAKKSGDAQAVTDAEARVNRARDAYALTSNVDTLVGTPTAQSLAIRRWFMKQDYTLAEMERSMQVANKGENLTPKQAAEVKRLHDAIEAKNKLLEQYLRKHDGQYDKTAVGLKVDADLARREFQRDLTKSRLSHRAISARVLGGVGDTFNTFRAIMTSLDLSAVLRQGGLAAFGHPIVALKDMWPMLRALRSERNQAIVTEEIRNNPDYALARKGRVSFTDIEGPLSAMEERMMGRWLRHVPGVAASARAYTTFLNRMRMDLFSGMVRALPPEGRASSDELTTIGNYVNYTTGRGSIGTSERTLVGMNTIFFAPRYTVSRFQYLFGIGTAPVEAIFGSTKAAHRIIVSEYARTLIGATIVYAAGSLAGGIIEKNMLSSDFGKIRFGNTRLDPMSGLIQGTVLLARELSGLTKTQAGDIVPIRGSDVPYGGRTGWTVLSDWLRLKLSPAFATGVNYLVGEDPLGNPVTPAATAQNLLVPMSFNDILETMKEQGVPETVALGVLSLLGMGIQTYQNQNEPTIATGGD